MAESLYLPTGMISLGLSRMRVIASHRTAGRSGRVSLAGTKRIEGLPSLLGRGWELDVSESSCAASIVVSSSMVLVVTSVLACDVVVEGAVGVGPAAALAVRLRSLLVLILCCDG
jgi:hypothetical protein